MTVLMGEHKSAVDYGHAWDQLGENGEVLGRAPGLPLLSCWMETDVLVKFRTKIFDILSI